MKSKKLYPSLYKWAYVTGCEDGIIDKEIRSWQGITKVATESQNRNTVADNRNTKISISIQISPSTSISFGFTTL